MSLVRADCDGREGSQSCSPWYIAGRLGQRDRSQAWVIGQIEQLIDHAGFPLPLIHMIHGKPVRGVKASSRWQREAVDRWFDAQPSARLSLSLEEQATQVEAERISRELDERAELIAEGRL